jgi:hypothetical protein
VNVGCSTLCGGSQEIVYMHEMETRTPAGGWLLAWIEAGLTPRLAHRAGGGRLKRLARINVGQPAVPIGRLAIDHVEERDLQRFGDRSSLT